MAWFLPLLAFFGVTLAAKKTQASTPNKGVVYDTPFGPYPAPNTPLPQYISLAQLSTIISNVANKDGFPYRPEVMIALAKVESGDINSKSAPFDRKAYRYEPHLGEASYGIFQMLASTAKDMGLKGNPEQLYDPYIATEYMIKYVLWIKNFLAKKLGREPTLTEILYSYNGGVGTFLRNKNGTPATRQYVKKYNTAFDTVVA